MTILLAFIRRQRRPITPSSSIDAANLVNFCRRRPFSSSAIEETEKSNNHKKNKQQFYSILDHRDLISQIPLEDVRNFCFIAHVDHGKSSLSSRVLELAGNLGLDAQKFAHQCADLDESTNINGQTPNKESKQIVGRESKERIELMDTLAVEQQRGITVKASSAAMLYPHASAIGPTGLLLLNMYDTPGHVDFGREVTRSLCFVQGAVLLLDATQGIQAQTWSVYDKAKALPEPPHMLLALTKVDLESARPEHVALTAAEWLDNDVWSDDPDTIFWTSARNRIGVRRILDAICTQVPAPKPLPDDDSDGTGILRAQVVDSWYDDRGVNCLVRILSGKLTENDRIGMIQTNNINDKNSSAAVIKQQQSTTSYSVQEVGLLLPHATRTGILQRGQMGTVRFGLRDPRQALPGTILVWHKDVSNKEIFLPTLPSYLTTTHSVLYASVHPPDAEFDELCHAIERLALNDTGLEVQITSAVGSANDSGGPFLGPGLRVGFQGLLHVEVFRQRLLDEFGIDAIVTPPKVPYTITMMPSKSNNLKEEVTFVIEDLKDWPENTVKFKVQEPVVNARIVARVEDAGAVMELIQRKRGTNLQTTTIDEEKWLFTAVIPWGEVVIDFHDQLKTITAGYGSLDTSPADPPLTEAKLSKVDIMLNDEIVEPLSFVCHKDNAQGEARKVVKKLQEVLPRQQFVTVIQAKAEGKIIAAERLKAYRKDVLTKSGKVVGGGDMTRKKKLLEKQKKGKKRMQDQGRVSLSQDAFNSVITRSS